MSLVMQRFARVSMLGLDIDARLDIADEPVLEAEDLGRLLEYQRPRDARRLVRRLIDDGRLSWRSRHHGATDNSAENSMLVTNNIDPMGTVTRPVDVFVTTDREQVGTVVRDVDKLWLTERAALLVATASDTERAWQVRQALVDFFIAYRRERTSTTTLSSSVVHELAKAREEMRVMLDEVRAIRAQVAHTLSLDTRLHVIERSRRGTRVVSERAVNADAVAVVVRELLARNTGGLTAGEMIRIAGRAIDAARGRRTTPVMLGQALSTMPQFEKRWAHGHVVRWHVRESESA